MKKSKNEKAKWAKLARKPGKAASADLEAALGDLSAEKSNLEARNKLLAEKISDLELDALAGIEPSGEGGNGLQDAKRERQDIADKLGAMEKAAGLLAKALEVAKKREMENRLKDVVKEISLMTATKKAHLEKGLPLFAEGMAFLGSALGLDAGNPQSAFETLLSVMATMGSTFAASYQKALKGVKGPRVHASGRIHALKAERAKLEEALKVGEFAATEKKRLNFAEPPKVHIGLTDPGPTGAGQNQSGGLKAGAASEESGFIDFRDF